MQQLWKVSEPACHPSSQRQRKVHHSNPVGARPGGDFETVTMVVRICSNLLLLYLCQAHASPNSWSIYIEKGGTKNQ